MPNYVTPRGPSLLNAELEALEADLRKAVANSELADYDRRRLVAEHEGRMALLNDRIVTARVVEPGQGPAEEARFGSTVRFRHLDGPRAGAEQAFTIVGVDEAVVKDGRIAFTAPIVRALMGKRTGEVAAFRLGAQELRLELLAVSIGYSWPLPWSSPGGSSLPLPWPPLSSEPEDEDEEEDDGTAKSSLLHAGSSAPSKKMASRRRRIPVAAGKVVLRMVLRCW